MPLDISSLPLSDRDSMFGMPFCRYANNDFISSNVISVCILLPTAANTLSYFVNDVTDVAFDAMASKIIC